MDQDLKQSMFEYYRERVPEYDEVYEGRGPASISEPEAYTSEVEILRGIVEGTCSGDLLDIACGTAFWLPSYAVQVSHVTLFDQSQEMLDAARLRAKSANILDRCGFVRGDLFDQEFDGGQFDSALVGFLISHFMTEQEAAFFSRLKSVLKPGGVFLILDSVWTESRSRMREKEGPQVRTLNDGREFRIYKKYFDENDLVRMQDAHGMELVLEHFGGAFFAARCTFV